MDVFDLHCDLLAYLASIEEATLEDSDSRCSLPQMQAGGVRFQTLAIYTQTKPGSAQKGEAQFESYLSLLENPHFSSLSETSDTITIMPAIENASGICDEDEPLERAFSRLDRYLDVGPILYLSLTWNDENRFGGGNTSDVGLKTDGMRLLDYLSGQGVSIDLSHTSDALAHDILNYIDQYDLEITPIASHSNFRSVCHMARNLTDELAKEVLRRGGVIGMNFVQGFVGQNHPDDFLQQVKYGIDLGGTDQICLGADFFYEKLVPLGDERGPSFYAPFSDASCYPQYFELLSRDLSEEIIKKIAHQNFQQFLKRAGHLAL